MEPNRFDTLSRALAAHGPRRGVLGLLITMPIVGGLLDILTPDETEAAGRRKRRKKAHKHGKGRKRSNRKHKKKKPECTPTTCAEQGKACGRLPDGCGKSLDCGACTCATGCHPDCQTCNPATGLCDDVANDTPCDDGDACTQTDTCQDGTCVGTDPVVCTTPPGPCYQPTGTCQPNGTCFYAFKPQGAACNDGDDCAKPDACDGAGACIAGAPVVCPPPDQCHEQGVCNPATGLCSAPTKKADGTACDDGDACTQADTCQGGICVSGSPVVCPTGERCRAGGCACDATSEVCCPLATTDLQLAIDRAQSGDAIRLCAGTWNLTATVVIAKDLTLIGAGAGQTILEGGKDPGGNGVRVLDIVGGATVTLQDLTITKGQFFIIGTIVARAGGGIRNAGALTLRGVDVSGNEATFGGGIANTSGTVTLQTGTSLTGNKGAQGGGIYNYLGTMTLQTGSSVNGNTAEYGGGIWNNNGTMTLQSGSSLTGNLVTLFAGGIGNIGGTVTVEPEALVCDNSAPNSEPQCYAASGTINGPCPNPSNGICPS